MKQVLAIDIDDTLCPFSECFLTYLNCKYRKIFCMKDVTSYNLHPLYNISHEQMITDLDCFMNTQSMKTIPVLNNAVYVLSELADVYELHLVTARHLSFKEHTEKWVTENFQSLFADIHYCSFYNIAGKESQFKIHKATMCKRIGAVSLIDDNVDNITACISNGIIPILFGNYPWHSELDNELRYIRALNWLEVKKHTLIPEVLNM